MFAPVLKEVGILPSELCGALFVKTLVIYISRRVNLLFHRVSASTLCS
ncbi:Prolyl oligopeptidase [Psidium guajava]|nr:Prolyl oligopeptidase [Psidium guajava]